MIRKPLARTAVPANRYWATLTPYDVRCRGFEWLKPTSWKAISLTLRDPTRYCFYALGILALACALIACYSSDSQSLDAGTPALLLNPVLSKHPTLGRRTTIDQVFVMNGTCGSASGVATGSEPDRYLCSSSAPASVPESGYEISTCFGSNWGTSVSCTALAARPTPWTPIRSPAIYVATNGSDTAGNGTIRAPYLTLEKAQSVARSGSTKLIYLRAGTYIRTASLQLRSADDGETWSGYPGDPVDAAILDNSNMPFVDGTTYTGVPKNSQIALIDASNVTIDGLQLRYSRGAGIFVHNGTGNTITHCVVHDNDGGGPPFNTGDGQNTAGIYSTWYAGITSDGTDSFTISNNYLYNLMTAGIAIANAHSNLMIKNNFVDAVNLSGQDSGGIHLEDLKSVSTNIRVFNNYVRDAGGRDVGGHYSRHTYVGGNKTNPGSNNTHALYSDGGSIDVTWSGNIVTGNFATAGMFHDTKNVKYTGNIIDIGNRSTWIFWNQSEYAGNSWTGNIILSSYQGSATVPAYISEPSTDAATIPLTTNANNVYFNYAGGIVNYGGDNNPTQADSNPILEDPQISGWTYTIAPTSPVFNSPVNFQPIVGGWGPPGFTVPHIGTPPSSPH